jgi:creatinine amidohydrolase
VSISAHTLASTVTDLLASLERSGINQLILVNPHGGNYVPANVVQEANVGHRRMALFRLATTGLLLATQLS